MRTCDTSSSLCDDACDVRYLGKTGGGARMKLVVNMVERVDEDLSLSDYC